MKKLIKPNSDLIERVAANFAAEWFEAAAATPGMNMERHKYKNDPRRFARLNLEKFIPQAISVLIGMLGRPDVALEMKEEIYSALQDRNNDASNVISTEIEALPDMNMQKVLELYNKPDKIDQSLIRKREKPLEISSLNKTDTAPFKATRH